MREDFNIFGSTGNAEFSGRKITKAGLASGLRGDEVKYAFTQALRRAMRPTWGRCPSRVASKTSMPTLNGQRNFHLLYFRRLKSEKGSNYFQKTFTVNRPNLDAQSLPSNEETLSY
jgi:hypothetical protein